ncbi:MAG: alpha/beta hydrolase-fold protein [Melioribacteraceae bacterium]|nr:alpha/beta hydrolase-fold protein [Melioribacteraceae bacterium]
MKDPALITTYNNVDEIIGHHELLHEYYSINLKNERDIIIWFPPSYQSSSKRYPVLYMHDGQNLFSPSTAFIGKDWRVDETATNLINQRKIEEFIVVGIYNNSERLEEYNLWTVKGKKYASFIIRELKPYVDETYRTKKDRSNTFVMGSSLGGLCSFQLIWNYPSIFSKAACLSSSFWIEEKKIFKEIKNDKAPLKDISFYIDCGDDEKELIDDSKKMMKLLEEIGYVKNQNLFTHIEKEGKHSEEDWANRLHIPLIKLFPRKNDSSIYIG